ncbi:MAG: glycosyltransferase [Armatimonadetes bacterium]|nr:glycosyltransferase [Armatimonadota bacterium]
MSTPIISVLLPAFNAANTLNQAIESLIRQTFASFEVVAIDDGSADGTADILDRWAKQDARIRVIHIPHSGIVNALNIGFAECKGKFIARMDADDVSHPDRLRLQIEFMQTHQNVSVCGCLVRSFPRPKVKKGFLRYEEWLNSLISHEDISRDIFIESPLAHPSVMMRASDLRMLGGYRDIGWPEDYDLWLRFYMAGKRFAKIRRVLLFWRETPGRLTFADSRYSLENFMRLKAHFLAQYLPQSRPIIIWGAGMTGKRLMKHLIREGVKLTAVVDIDANKIGQVVRGVPIIRPEDLEIFADAFVIAAVASEGARYLIRRQLIETNRKELQDFICAA